MNQIILVGKLHESLSFKETAANIPMAQGIIEVKRPYQSGDGQESDLYQVTFWRGNSEELKGKFQKGDLVVVKGRLSANNFLKDNGEVMYRAEITGERMTAVC